MPVHLESSSVLHKPRPDVKKSSCQAACQPTPPQLPVPGCVTVPAGRWTPNPRAGSRGDCDAPSVREGRAERVLLMGRARAKLSWFCGTQWGLLLPALPRTAALQRCLGQLHHKATLLPGLLRVPMWHHTAGARCSLPLHWEHPCGSPGAAAGRAQAARSPAWVTNPVARGPVAMGESLSRQGAPQMWGAGFGPSTPVGVVAAGSEVRAHCPGREDTQAVVPEQPPPPVMSFQRDTGWLMPRGVALDTGSVPDLGYF